ncbi:MAG: hypothetical protein WA864_24605 [Acetobacteraceae bacterium]|jgi:hypothetical protein
MIRTMLAATAVLGLLSAVPPAAGAVTCANGVYRAGCAGPNGAAVVKKQPVVRPPATVHCVKGVYRAGCAGPNGAAVVR